MSTLLRSQCALSRSISYKGHDSEPDSEGDDKLPPPTESVGPPCRASRKRSRISISTERVASEDTVPSIENHAVTRTASQLSPVISSTIVSRSLPDPKRQMKNQEEPDLQSPLSPGVLARIQKSTHFIDHDDQGYGYDDQTPLPCEQSQSIEPQQTENSSANTGSFPGNSGATSLAARLVAVVKASTVGALLLIILGRFTRLYDGRSLSFSTVHNVF